MGKTTETRKEGKEIIAKSAEIMERETVYRKLIDKEIKAIKTYQGKADNLALKIGACISRMADETATEENKIAKPIIDRLRDEVGISKATAYASYAICKRYGDPLTKEITDRYNKWSFRALLECKDMSDAEITNAGFTDKTMIKEIVAYKKAQKALKAGEQEQPKAEETSDIEITVTEIDGEQSAMQTSELKTETDENVSRETFIYDNLIECYDKSIMTLQTVMQWLFENNINGATEVDELLTSFANKCTTLLNSAMQTNRKEGN